uniref:Uncharacterized protein n=1 Tax=Anopheles arabiensis TaxID=7173 RepID=A0A182IH21_ANOAR
RRGIVADDHNLGRLNDTANTFVRYRARHGKYHYIPHLDIPHSDFDPRRCFLAHQYSLVSIFHPRSLHSRICVHGRLDRNPAGQVQGFDCSCPHDLRFGNDSIEATVTGDKQPQHK